MTRPAGGELPRLVLRWRLKTLVDWSSAAEAGMEFCRVVESAEHIADCRQGVKGADKE